MHARLPLIIRLIAGGETIKGSLVMAQLPNQMSPLPFQHPESWRVRRLSR